MLIESETDGTLNGNHDNIQMQKREVSYEDILRDPAYSTPLLPILEAPARIETSGEAGKTECCGGVAISPDAKEPPCQINSSVESSVEDLCPANNSKLSFSDQL
jgi:hypothetical protein